MRRILSVLMSFIGMFLLSLCPIAAFAAAPTSPGSYILPYTYNGTTYTKALQVITLSNDPYGAEKAATYFYNGTAKFHGGYSVFKFFSSPKVLLVNSVDDIYGNGNDYVYEYTQSQDPDDPYWFGLANPVCFDSAYLKSSVTVYQETNFSYQNSNYHCNFNFVDTSTVIVSADTNFFSLKWPLTGTFASRTVALAFGATWTFGECPSGTYKKHAGTDVNATSGEDVYAAHAGVVKAIHYDASWAYAIIIEDSNGQFTTVYWHVNAYGGLAVNDTVTRGQKIATIANLGGNTHFHFGIRSGTYDSSLSLAGALPVASCGGYPAYPENLLNPAGVGYQ